jgi:hypothetical protein
MKKEVENKKVVQVGTIDFTPSWRKSMYYIIAALENGTNEGKAMAREELYRLADVMDEMNKVKE